MSLAPPLSRLPPVKPLKLLKRPKPTSRHHRHRPHRRSLWWPCVAMTALVKNAPNPLPRAAMLAVRVQVIAAAPAAVMVEMRAMAEAVRVRGAALSAVGIARALSRAGPVWVTRPSAPNASRLSRLN